MKYVLYWLGGIHANGVMFVVSHFYPCYFTQDIKLTNNGYDLITLKETGQSYWRGLYRYNYYYRR